MIRFRFRFDSDSIRVRFDPDSIPIRGFVHSKSTQVQYLFFGVAAAATSTGAPVASRGEAAESGHPKSMAADLVGLEREACAIFATMCGDAQYMTKEQMRFVALAAGMDPTQDWETEYVNVDANIGWTVVDFVKVIERQCQGAAASTCLQHALVECVLTFRTTRETKAACLASRAGAVERRSRLGPAAPPPAEAQPLAPPPPATAPPPAKAQPLALPAEAQPPAPPPPATAPPPAKAQPPPPAAPPPPAKAQPLALQPLPPVQLSPEPRVPRPLAVGPRAQPLLLANRGRCAWHQPLGEYCGLEGFGNARDLPVHHVDWNDYSNVGRCIQMNDHFGSTLFYGDEVMKLVREGALSIVACRTKAHRFVKYECKACGDYVRAKHGPHEKREAIAEDRCKVLWYFQFENEMDPQPAKASV